MQNLVYLNVYLKWDPLRDDPRFQELIRRMNYPEVKESFYLAKHLQLFSFPPLQNVDIADFLNQGLSLQWGMLFPAFRAC